MDSLEGRSGTPAARPQIVGASPGRPEPDIDEAIRAAQNGDEAAFRVLFRHLQPRLLRYLTGLVGPDAEDVAADAWLQIARDLGTFSGDADKLRGWASRIARNRAIDHMRYMNRRPVSNLQIDDVLDLVSAENVERSALDSLSTDKAIAMISGLPRDQAEAVLLRVVMGLDAATAAQVLGKRPGAVRTAAYRGLRNLAKRL
ncbi:MAG TPA: RNA polymerase sigma factor [Streptosporangiaceae bacterium]|nr:RNA polymerase sigma factor [Streptosporangiaceae bacterium]